MRDGAFDVAFGPVTIRIEADSSLSAVHAVLRRWLGAGIGARLGQADVVIHLTGPQPAQRPPVGPRLFVGKGAIDAQGFSIWDGRAWTSTLERRKSADEVENWWCRLENGPFLRVAEWVPTLLLRFSHEHYFSCAEIRASTFLYRHLVPIVQLALLRRRATFVHASAVRHGLDGGMLLFGWGGSGKTSASTALYLSEPDRWQFMSDDLAIVDAFGRIHHSPLPLNVFPYNLTDFPGLEQHVLGRVGAIEALQWRLRARLWGGDGVARRIPAWGGPGTSTECPLVLCIHLQRSSDVVPVAEDCDAAAIARISKNILMFELRQSLEMFAVANSFHSDAPPGVPTMDEVMVGAELVLVDSLRASRNVSVRVPRTYRPLELGAFGASIWNETRGPRARAQL